MKYKRCYMKKMIYKINMLNFLYWYMAPFNSQAVLKHPCVQHLCEKVFFDLPAKADKWMFKIMICLYQSK